MLAELSRELDTLDALCDTRPLTTWNAWHTETGSSQRNLLKLLTRSKEVGWFGGNRTGKTELARTVVVAILSGSDHPDAASFWRRHGLDPRSFPRGPDTGWVIAVSSNDSLRYHRRQILSLIPKWGPRHPESTGDGKNWHAWNLYGRGEARLQWMVPGYDRPAEIWFKSEDQDVMTFQGDAIRVAWHDEEGATDRRYEQVQYRLIDKDGWQILTDTPIHGRTWVYNRFVLRQDNKGKPVDPGIAYGHIYSIDNPYLPRHRVKKIANDAVRGRGEFIVLEGRIWPKFGERHRLPYERLPNDAVYRVRAIDFGTRHPFVCLHGAVLKRPLTIGGRRIKDGSIVIYRERYVAEVALAEHVDAIRESEGYRKMPAKVTTIDRQTGYKWVPRDENAELIEGTWADPEDAQQMLQLNHLYDMPAMKGLKDVHAGIQAIKARLELDEDDEPSIYVMENCTNTIREWEDYQYVKAFTSEGGEKDVPSQKSDHTCDAGRYMVMGVDLSFG